MDADWLYTILIMSHNRSNELIRLIRFYNKLKCKIVICDSSDKPLKYSFHKNIEYLHVLGSDFAEKLKIGAQLIKTDYVLLHPDDDFVSTSGLREAALFLEKNSNYVSAIGQSIAFSVSDSKIHLSLRDTDQYLALRAKDEIKSSTERMHSVFSPYSQSIWTLHNTEVFKRFTQADISWLESACLFERFFSLFFALHGNTKFLPIFFCARQLENINSVREKDAYNYKGPGTILFSPKYESEIGKMCKVLAAEMVRLENISERDAYNKIQDVIEQYKKTFHSNRHNLTNSKMDRLLSKYNPDKILAKFVKPIVVSNDRWGKSFFFQKNKLPCYRTSARNEIKNIVSIIRNDLKN